MPTNELLPFCPTDTGTNLPTQAAYAADADRTSGQKSGVASSALNNKALRQANFLTSQLAQFIVDKLDVDVEDDADTDKLLAQINAAFLPLPPKFTNLTTTGSSTFQMEYIFFCAPANATQFQFYSHNGFNYEIQETIAGGTMVRAIGDGDPLASGTLTKTSGGSGDATIDFYAMRMPIRLEVEMVGGGSGGGGSTTGSTGSTSTAGGNSTFGSSIFTCNGGGATSSTHSTGSSGGNATIAGVGKGVAIKGAGARSGYQANGSNLRGENGGASPFGSPGIGASTGSPYIVTSNGNAAAANTGSGGGGASGTASGSNESPGGGGASGGYIKGFIENPTGTYPYTVANGGAGGGPVGSGATASGGAGGSGRIIVTEIYQ